MEVKTHRFHFTCDKTTFMWYYYESYLLMDQLSHGLCIGVHLYFGNNIVKYTWILGPKLMIFLEIIWKYFV